MVPARARVLAVLAMTTAFAGAVTSGGCAWDWTVGDALEGGDATTADARAASHADGGEGTGSSGDGGVRLADGDSGGRDGTSPAPPGDDDGPDATTGPDAAPAPDGSPPPPDSGPPDAGCAELFAEADASRAAARVCALASGECTDSIPDPCGCAVFVADTTSSASRAFTSDVKAIEQAGCTLDCTGCGVTPVEGICLENPSGFACSP